MCTASLAAVASCRPAPAAGRCCCCRLKLAVENWPSPGTDVRHSQLFGLAASTRDFGAEGKRVYIIRRRTRNNNCRLRLLPRLFIYRLGVPHQLDLLFLFGRKIYVCAADPCRKNADVQPSFRLSTSAGSWKKGAERVSVQEAQPPRLLFVAAVAAVNRQGPSHSLAVSRTTMVEVAVVCRPVAA